MRYFWLLFLAPFVAIFGPMVPIGLLVVVALMGFGAFLWRKYGWLLLLVLITINAPSQEFGSYGDLPFIASASSGITSSLFPSNLLYFHWVASDLTMSNNVAIWTDRVQAANLTQVTVANQPLMTTNGVQLTAAHTLNGTNTSSTFFPATFACGYLIYKAGWNQSASGVFFDAVNGDITYHNFSAGNNFWSDFPPSPASGPVSTNIVTDYFGGVPLVGSQRVYTNGVYDGSVTFTINYDFTSFQSANSLVIYIQELAWWTNSSHLTAAQLDTMAAQLTAYRRSVYGGQ